MVDRRRFLEWLALGLGGVGLPTAGRGEQRQARAAQTDAGAAGPHVQPTSAKARVVVVGGGMAGAACAKFLRLWGDQLDITLVERDARYTSCILSNLVLTGQRSLEQLEFSYATLRDKYAIRVVRSDVAGLDPVKKTLRLAGGETLSADRIVLAPGVEFDVIPGLESAAAQDRVPHAWKAGAQTLTLRDRLRAMPAGGVFVLTIPKAPFRCPPGPYERACIVADYLKKNKPRAKLIVLDANPDIVAERATFKSAFSSLHAEKLEYRPDTQVREIDAAAGVVRTNVGDLQAHLINAIAPHRAGEIITASGLSNVDGRWAGVDVLTYESTAAPGVHVIGDSSATTQPKAGHIANQEAKVCADAVARLLQGLAVDPAPVTSSACYSTVTMSTASWLTAVFAYEAASRTMKAVPASSGEAARPSAENFKDMEKWFRALMADTFA